MVARDPSAVHRHKRITVAVGASLDPMIRQTVQPGFPDRKSCSGDSKLVSFCVKVNTIKAKIAPAAATGAGGPASPHKLGVCFFVNKFLGDKRNFRSQRTSKCINVFVGFGRFSGGGFLDLCNLGRDGFGKPFVLCELVLDRSLEGGNLLLERLLGRLERTVQGCDGCSQRLVVLSQRSFGLRVEFCNGCLVLNKSIAYGCLGIRFEGS